MRYVWQSSNEELADTSYSCMGHVRGHLYATAASSSLLPSALKGLGSSYTSLRPPCSSTCAPHGRRKPSTQIYTYSTWAAIICACLCSALIFACLCYVWDPSHLLAEVLVDGGCLQLQLLHAVDAVLVLRNGLRRRLCHLL